MDFNEQTVDGLYLLDQSVCAVNVDTRVTKSNVPQANGSILPARFLTGASMVLKIQMWEDEDTPACDELLRLMLDELSGAFVSLLNAGDNEGRIEWVTPGANTRMLDDIRLFTYPSSLQFDDNTIPFITVAVDTQYPYAEDLSQSSPTVSGSFSITNGGNTDFWPVWKINGPFSAFTLENTSRGQQIEYDDTLPDAVPVAGGDYAEINTFTGTIFLNGSGADLSAGIVELNTDEFALGPNAENLVLTGAPDAVLLHQAAWA